MCPGKLWSEGVVHAEWNQGLWGRVGRHPGGKLDLGEMSRGGDDTTDHGAAIKAYQGGQAGGNEPVHFATGA